MIEPPPVGTFIAIEEMLCRVKSHHDHNGSGVAVCQVIFLNSPSDLTTDLFINLHADQFESVQRIADEEVALILLGLDRSELS